MKLALGLLAVALLLPHTAKAVDSTQEILSACRPITQAEVMSGNVQAPDTFQAGYCWGLFTSIQKIIVHVNAQKKRLYGVCAPSEGTLSQLIAVFTSYAQKNPQRLHEDYFYVALDSLREAFPCR